MSSADCTSVLTELEAVIAARDGEKNGKASYTAELLGAGKARCAKKFGEEAIELVIASMQEDRQHTIAETADVLYHLLVLLRANGVELESVMRELHGRFRQSGLQEKASRSKG